MVSARAGASNRQFGLWPRGTRTCDSRHEMSSPSEIPENQARVSPDGQWTWNGHDWARTNLDPGGQPPPVLPPRSQGPARDRWWRRAGQRFASQESLRWSSPRNRRVNNWVTIGVVVVYGVIFGASRAEHLWHRFVTH